MNSVEQRLKTETGQGAPQQRVLRRGMRRRLMPLLQEDPSLSERLRQVRRVARDVRTSEYHVTHACNIRCKSCWFFEYGFDQLSRDQSDAGVWRAFIEQQKRRGITSALLIGGEPTLHLDRIALFVEAMPFVTVSTNGLRRLPKDGFERVAIAVTLFGGGPRDDQLRGIRPNGQRLRDLFETALHNYRNDDRATFIYAVAAESSRYIPETIRRIRDNGNLVTFNYYSRYGEENPLGSACDVRRLLDAALQAKSDYPETVVCTPYVIRAIITGRSHWESFGYHVCPSISVDHPDHKERLKNGNPVLPLFNSYAADAKTINFCCTSGHCRGCRDSQAVYSWLITSMPYFLDSPDDLRTWLEIAESYWGQFVWSPYRGAAPAPHGA